MQIEIVGVYPIAADVPCHLFECLIEREGDEVNFAEFTQDPEHENAQVPYDQRWLNTDGTGHFYQDNWYGKAPEGRRLRATFFLHFVDFSRPLSTPAGEVRIPKAIQIPDRLHFIDYCPP